MHHLSSLFICKPEKATLIPPKLNASCVCVCIYIHMHSECFPGSTGLGLLVKLVLTHIATCPSSHRSAGRCRSSGLLALLPLPRRWSQQGPTRATPSLLPVRHGLPVTAPTGLTQGPAPDPRPWVQSQHRSAPARATDHRPARRKDTTRNGCGCGPAQVRAGLARPQAPAHSPPARPGGASRQRNALWGPAGGTHARSRAGCPVPAERRRGQAKLRWRWARHACLVECGGAEGRAAMNLRGLFQDFNPR